MKLKLSRLARRGHHGDHGPHAAEAAVPACTPTPGPATPARWATSVAKDTRQRKRCARSRWVANPLQCLRLAFHGDEHLQAQFNSYRLLFLSVIFVFAKCDPLKHGSTFINRNSGQDLFENITINIKSLVGFFLSTLFSFWKKITHE